MGLFGSKEGNSSPNEGQLNKDESPDRYGPYSADSDAETYDTEALSIMDINDIIGVQAEPVGESTLESEIAALSEIITDTEIHSSRDNSTNGNKDTLDVTLNLPVSVDDKDNIAAGQCDNLRAKTIGNKLSESELKVNIVTVSDGEKVNNAISECVNDSKAAQSGNKRDYDN